MYNSGKGLALNKQIQCNKVGIYTSYYLQVIFIYKILFLIFQYISISNYNPFMV